MTHLQKKGEVKDSYMVGCRAIQTYEKFVASIEPDIVRRDTVIGCVRIHLSLCAILSRNEDHESALQQAKVAVAMIANSMPEAQAKLRDEDVDQKRKNADVTVMSAACHAMAIEYEHLQNPTSSLWYEAALQMLEALPASHQTSKSLLLEGSERVKQALKHWNPDSGSQAAQALEAMKWRKAREYDPTEALPEPESSSSASSEAHDEPEEKEEELPEVVSQEQIRAEALPQPPSRRRHMYFQPFAGSKRHALQEEVELRDDLKLQKVRLPAFADFWHNLEASQKFRTMDDKLRVLRENSKKTRLDAQHAQHRQTSFAAEEHGSRAQRKFGRQRSPKAAARHRGDERPSTAPDSVTTQNESAVRRGSKSAGVAPQTSYQDESRPNTAPDRTTVGSLMGGAVAANPAKLQGTQPSNILEDQKRPGTAPTGDGTAGIQKEALLHDAERPGTAPADVTKMAEEMKAMQAMSRRMDTGKDLAAKMRELHLVLGMSMSTPDLTCAHLGAFPAVSNIQATSSLQKKADQKSTWAARKKQPVGRMKSGLNYGESSQTKLDYFYPVNKRSIGLGL